MFTPQMDANGRKFKEWCFSLLGSLAFLQHNLLPVESRVLEIQDKSRLEAGDLQVVKHLTDMLVANFIHRLHFNNEAMFNFEIGYVVIDMLTPVIDRVNVLFSE